MKFIKNHSEIILEGIFSVYTVLIFFFASDEGTRLLLMTFGEDYSSEAIALFQRKYVWWIFIGYGLIVLLLIAVKIWTHKKISALEKDITKKDNIIAEQKEKLTNYNLLRQNIDLIFKEHLKSIAKSLEFSHNERISLYIIDENKFVRCARFSQNPKYNQPGRASYPLHEGVIGEAWSKGIEFIATLPDAKKDLDNYIQKTKNKYNIGENTVRNFSMHPRLILGYRISNFDQSEHNAVIIVESTNKGFKTKNTILPILERNRDCLYSLIRDFRDFIPALAYAKEEDM